MHARRFSSSKHNTQGFVGDELATWLRTAFFVADDSAPFISSVVAADARVSVSVASDPVDDAVISTSLLSDELIDDDPESTCSRACASRISFT